MAFHGTFSESAIFGHFCRHGCTALSLLGDLATSVRHDHVAPVCVASTDIIPTRPHHSSLLLYPYAKGLSYEAGGGGLLSDCRKFQTGQGHRVGVYISTVWMAPTEDSIS